jgi:NTE family protein
MNKRQRPSAAQPKEERILALQGGGALGAYQAGVYEALAASGEMPQLGGRHLNWRDRRCADRRQSTRSARAATARVLGHGNVVIVPVGAPGAPGAELRSGLNEACATMGAMFGLTGFFAPRFPAAPFQFPGTAGSLSFYDAGPLRVTLEQLVDFEMLNSGERHPGTKSTSWT